MLVASSLTQRYVLDSRRVVLSKSSTLENAVTTTSRVLLVSDLDGTMVGNDEYTREFRKFWESDARHKDSKLVYSTGRSFESFLGLITSKRDILVEPDGLICAVGTKVFLRSSDPNCAWIEDEAWAEALDVNWSCDVVGKILQQVIDKFGSENIHFRPPDEQNKYKLTVGVKDEFVNDVHHDIRSACDDDRIECKIIISGSGGWKFIDCVSTGAGKLESLEHIREQLGFEASETVACGDSGNDILMMSGESRAVVVGNAELELREWANNFKSKNELESSRIFLAGEFEALGILEGLKHFELC